MFINCPQCRALVATDPVTDLPPPQCPRCAATLRDPTATPPPAPEVRAAPTFELGYLLEVPTAEAGGDAPTPSPLSAQIHQLMGDAGTPLPAPSGFIPIASLLRPADAAAAVSGDARDAATHAENVAPAAPTITPAITPATAAPPGGALPSASGPTPPATAPHPSTHAARSSEHRASPVPGAASPVAAAPAAVEPAGPPSAAVPAHAADDSAHDGVRAGAGDSAAPFGAARTGTAETAADEIGTGIPAVSKPAPPAAATPRATPLPSFARRRAALPGAGFDWTTTGALAALALLLALQLLLADRARLAADARWRPLLANVCGVLGCALPPWREPAAFTVLARDVRPHPSTPGALRVTASFRNDAHWPQPWPRLRLVLSDVDGRPVAARDFAPREYLGAAPEQVELASGQAATVAMDIAEPGPRSVAFDFELH